METWVLNETVNDALAKTDISFSSNSLDFTSISASYYRPEMSPIQQLQVYYGNIQIVYDSGSSVTMYGWDDQAYRTITFATTPTGDLLTWLQANGTKQSTPQKLPTPTNVSITGTTVQWDEVANATSYDVLVDGEVWENVPQPSSGETWVLNNTLTLENIPLYNIPFTSGGQSYEGMEVSIDSGGAGYVRYSKDGLQYGSYDEVYTKDGPMDGWNNSKWRTIVYPTPVTDVTLLPWLQANGTKQ